jgi:hypothetical protein
MIAQPTRTATPVINLAGLINRMAALTATSGEPAGLDLSVPLREIAVSLPTAGTMTAWSAQLSAHTNVNVSHIDELGNVASATATIDTIMGPWTIRLCHQRPHQQQAR